MSAKIYQLIKGTAAGTPLVKAFYVSSPIPVSVFVGGLAGVEVIDIQFLSNITNTNIRDPQNALDADWTDYFSETVQQQLKIDNNMIGLYVPGQYRVVSSATTSGEITVGWCTG